MNATQKLRQMAGEIEALAAPTAQNPAKIADAWSLVARLIGRMPVDQGEAARVCSERDLEGLITLIDRLENPKQSEPTKPQQSYSEHELNEAMRVFRKRLKLGRLADESRLGGRYTSGGRKSNIDAIELPTDVPTDLWNALIAAGRLVNTGQGFYTEPNKGPTGFKD